MDKQKTIAEVRCDYREDETGLYYIDVYLTEDDNEEGFTIATVDADGDVNWKESQYHRVLEYDRTPILEAIEEAKDKQSDIKQELVDKCLEEIREDFASGDITAVDELLKFVPTKNLQAYLPEN